MKQSSKQNTIKTTKPVASDRAGFLTSTVQDTTGWSGDHDDNKVEGNFMALATDASTTITDCDTNYPDLWANAPTAWRSGSDLVIPSQGNAENIETTATLNWTAGTNVGSIDSSSVVDVVKAGRLVTVSGTVNVDLTSTGSFSFNCPTSDLPFALEDHRVTGAFVRTTNPTTTNTGDIAPSAASTTINFRGTATVNTDQPYCFMFYYHTTDADVNTTDSTPVIQLVDNIAAGALGLPPASATEAGTVTPEDQTFSGKKTFTETTTGNIFESYSSKTVLSSSSPTLVANGVVNNLSGMYMVTISRSNTGGSYSAMSNAFINITSSGSAVLSHVRQDPDCTITASGGSVFAQAGAPYNGQTYKATFVCLMRFE